MSTRYKFNDPQGMYFVTFATVGWVDVFTRQLYRDIFCDSIKYCQEQKGLSLHAWCLMSNHVHRIFSVNSSYSHSEILLDLKKFTSKSILEAIDQNPKESRKEWMLNIFKSAGERNSNNKNFQFWQQDNHQIELYSPSVTLQKLDYIHFNPVTAGIVHEPYEYLYSSARDYHDLKVILDLNMIDRPMSLIGYVG